MATTWFRAMLVLLIATTCTAPAFAACRACSIVDEGLFPSAVVGITVYERHDTRFYKARITAIQTSPFRLVYWVNDSTGKSGWNDATMYFSEARMKEALEDVGNGKSGYYESDSEKRDKAGLVAACAACLDSKVNDRGIGGLLMCHACCNSQAAKRFGTPPGAC